MPAADVEGTEMHWGQGGDAAKPAREDCTDDAECVAPDECWERHCLTPTCTNTRRDGEESDVDCGGNCGKCADGRACQTSEDCSSNVCSAGRCRAASCDDAVLNGNESDVDCGGPCPVCRDGQACDAGVDCASGLCSGSLCQAASCHDRLTNGRETAVDCGGDCAGCAIGSACAVGEDCASSSCQAGQCIGPSCTNGSLDDHETAVDCGGADCLPCPDAAACHAAADCISAVCSEDLCAVPTCLDRTKNGDETDTDCGGSCPPCAAGLACQQGSDCETGSCDDVCRAPACGDGVKNGSETGIDCGGGCAPCAPGAPCNAAGDCQSSICNGTCTSSTCTDKVRNGNESDIDCGGTCTGCAATRGCALDADCATGFCKAGVCTKPACDDKLLNGGEVDVDCGGPCAKCGAAHKCGQAADCASKQCFFGRCADGSVSLQAARVSETGVGPLKLVNGGQLEPGGPDELVAGNTGETSFGVLSGFDPQRGFTSLQVFDNPTERNVPAYVGDVDGDGTVELILQRFGPDLGSPLPTPEEAMRVTQIVNGQLKLIDAWPERSNSLTFVDLNKDKILDVVVPSEDYNNAFVYSKLGLGGGKFAPKVVALQVDPANGYPNNGYFGMHEMGVHVLQLGAGTVPALIVHVANVNYGTPENYLALGDGAGAFKSPPSIAPSQVSEASDLNHDGITDITGYESDGVTTIHALRLGLGNGQFGAPASIPLVPGYFSPTWMRNLDHDGDEEILTLENTSLGPELRIFERESKQISLVTQIALQSFDANPQVVFGDFDANGLEDIVVSHDGEYSWTEPGYYFGANLAVFYQDTPLHFVNAERLPTPDLNVSSVTVADFDNNGVEDVLATYYPRTGAGGGSIGPTITYFDAQGKMGDEAVDFYDYGGSSRSGGSGDFNGDGRLDFVARAAQNQVKVLLRQPNGKFAPAQDLGTSIGLMPLDLNADQRMDLVLAHNHSIEVFLADSSGKLASSGESHAFGPDEYVDTLAHGDVNQDGKDDLIVTGLVSTSVAYNKWQNMGRAWIFTNQSNGRLGGGGTRDHEPFTYYGGKLDYRGATAATVGDVDGDGVSDVVVVHGELNRVAVFFGSGPGGSATSLYCNVLVNPDAVVAHDWNGDGRDDLAVATYASGALTFLLSKGRAGCEFAGHYRLTIRPEDLELLPRPGKLPSVVASGDVGAEIIDFRLMP